MFFPHLMNIRRGDLVLEIGPGAYPYWRADALVDKYDNESVQDTSQFGGRPQQTLGKPLFMLHGNELPFKDQSFDYIICSHVLEHVPHLELPVFIAEIMRVAKRAYIEFPRPLYDYIYDFDVHLNLLDIVDGEIICLPKERTRLGEVKSFTRYALQLRIESGFAVESLKTQFVAVGREFSATIPLRICANEEEFFARLPVSLAGSSRPNIAWRVAHRCRQLLHRLHNKNNRQFFERLCK